MALSIGVYRGLKIQVDNGPMLVIREIISQDKVRATFDGREILITDLERTKLMENVFVQVGLYNKSRGSQFTRLAFEAPRAIQIKRVQGRKIHSIS